MGRKRIPLQAVLLDLLVATASASVISADRLFAREGSTCAANFDPCSQGAFPSNFCCPSGQQCIALAGNTTLLCCPSGNGCPVISPISCDVSLQDADKHPDAVIKTTALNGALAHCGDGTCCPFGYSCAENKACQINANQNARPFEISPTSTASPSSTAAIPETGGSATDPGDGGGGNDGEGDGSDAGATTVVPVVTDNPGTGTSTAVIAGASVAAGLLTIGLAFMAFLCFRRRNKKKTVRESDTLKLSRSTSSFGNIISNPITAEGSMWRTDFMRKSPSVRTKRSSTASTAGLVPAGKFQPTPSPARTRDGGGGGGGITTPQAAAKIPPIRTMARQSSIAYGYGAPETSPYNYGTGANYHGGEAGSRETALPYPQTPPHQREPSSFSINVFADPQTVGSATTTTDDTGSRRVSRMTTFSDMLRSADLGGVSRGEPFVPSPLSSRR